MIDQLCQAYHWSFNDAMRLTVPQMIMLNHAAFVNAKKSGLVKDDQGDDFTVTVKGKTKSFDDMTDDERDAYYREW